MGDTVSVTCPYCGEVVEITIDGDTSGVMIQDCEVCCRPWRITVKWRGGDVAADVTRAE